MDYGRPDLADRLAAAYVVGTLRGAARRRFQALLPAHPALRAAERDWQDRLVPLAVSVAPQTPPSRVWQRIEAALGHGPGTVPKRFGIGFWRALSGLALAAVVGMAVLVMQPQPAQPPIVVVLSATGNAPGAVVPASFVAGISADQRALVVRPVSQVVLAPERALELWSVPASGAPRSLGLVSSQQATVVQRARVLDGADALAVTLEPAGGSPTGLPTGPIVFVGKLSS